MKKIVLIALSIFGVGIASSKADGRFVISFGDNGYRRQVAPVYVTPYSEHGAYHHDLAHEERDLHRDLKHEHKDFHREMRFDPSLRYEHGGFDRELAQEHGAVHHERSHDHERFHGYDY